MSSKMITGDEVISIIISCFNQGHYLEDAIKSTLAQTVCRTEIVVVDDGSTDNTAEVVHSYPQVAYIYQRNNGISSARNAGVRATTGDYIVFLDADDRLLPNAAKSGLDCFCKHPDSGFVFGRYQKIDADGAVISLSNKPPDECDFYFALLQRNLIGMQSTVLYPRDILERVARFDERLRCGEEYDLYLRISREFPVHKHDEVVAEYRRHDHNVSLNYRCMLEMTLRVLNAQIPYASRDSRYKEALKIGISNWQNHYGGLMVQDFRKNLRMHGLDRDSIRRLGNLASTYPQGIGLMTKKALRSALRTMIHRSLGMES
jgi:glycosyltransferase involved in cell wall biosynthesis